MTRNQLTYHANLETARHNAADEAERYRHNSKSEQLEVRGQDLNVQTAREKIAGDIVSSMIRGGSRIATKLI